MSVAENPTTEQLSANAQQQLAIGSAIGAVLVLAGLGFIFGGLPYAWVQGWEAMFEGSDLGKNEFLRDALLILLDLVAIGGLVWGAYAAMQKHPQPGLRAGIVFFAIYLFAALWVVFWIGKSLEGQFPDNAPVGYTVLVVILAAFLAGAGYLYLKVPAWVGFLEAAEHQGWFHLHGYKGNQGVRVRRGTIIGVLAVGAAGIYTMVSHKYFGTEVGGVSNDLAWEIPFSGIPPRYVFLMFKMHILIPTVLCVVLVWIAWRVVNIPVFADFLIATEAEMNKVSWTNRRRLWQDTIVVLTTVVLLTTFLFVLDLLWIKVLSAPGIQVLLIDPKQKQQEQQEKAQW
jgi:preprotein translocase SecE subunit